MPLYVCFISLALLYASAAAQVKVGLDVLLEQGDCALQSKRLGLITNATGVDRTGEPNYKRLLQAGFRIEALFAPEHGFQTSEEAGKRIQSTKTEQHIPIYSLYGKTKKPTPDMLQNLDAVLFDIQDIGTRCYTYISTMQLAMEACAEQRKAFIVLDRPNPIAPIAPQGFMLDTAYRSFVGYVRVPFVHALTVGELARMIQAEALPSLDLRVISMQNFSRQRFADEDSLFRLIAPSPNIRSISAMLLYPALVHLEGTNISEGRGTEQPFECFGAPFLNTEKVLAQLRAFGLSGVAFYTISFQVKIVDRRLLEPFALGVAILLALKRTHPNELQWLSGGQSLDRLAGTNRLRQLVQQGASLQAILEESRRSCAEYEQKWKMYWLYE
ncbi:MAG: exo-beta-N-acetylmuramidase NamZ domain-containing protein [Candidatus Thermochlorobacter sp.]